MELPNKPSPPDDDVPQLAPGELRIPQMAHDVKQLRGMMEALDELYSSVLVPGTDFGPGRKGGKTVLLKPGAEKVFGLFNLTAITRVVDETCDYKQGFFSFRVVCRAYDRRSGTCVAEAMGACNSREERLASDGDPYALHNVCLKMAEKRAFVNCALRLGMASDRFTQDMEDLSPTANPSTIMDILDHIHHPTFTVQERKRTRKFVADEPEPERAVDFLEKMKERIETYEAKRKGTNEEKRPENAGAAVPSPQAATELSAPVIHRGSPERVQVAMAYLRAGLSVIPLCPPGGSRPAAGKAPLFKDWNTFAKQLPTSDHVSVWWSKTPNANLGVVCGPASGVFVLDQDGEEGEQSLLMRELPPTPTVKTASGRHYYFALPDHLELKNAVKFLPGLDIRATGGQVVAPPSKHSSGVKYIWETMPLTLAQALADIKIPYEGEVLPYSEAPEWLLEAITP